MNFSYIRSSTAFASALRKAPVGTPSFLYAMAADADEMLEAAKDGTWTDDQGVLHDRPWVSYSWETVAAMAGYTPEECLKGGRSAGYQAQQRIMKYLTELGILTQYRPAVKGVQTAAYEVTWGRLGL